LEEMMMGMSGTEMEAGLGWLVSGPEVHSLLLVLLTFQKGRRHDGR
jgi:hypothetical protein